MQKSTYKISKMDCAAEEAMVRLKLENIKGVNKLEFDLQNRILNVYHTNSVNELSNSLSELNLGSEFLENETIKSEQKVEQEEINRKLLTQVLIINFGFFVIEVIAGYISNSMGLVGDSLDMLADAFVYGMSLIVVGKSFIYKKRVAALSGYSQLFLALLGYVEVLRRFLGTDELPDYRLMIIISIFALGANVLSLYILLKSKSKEVHMKATMICTSNDVIVNAGVIVAAVLVLLINSPYPDLIIGFIIFSLVLRGASRILKLA